MGYGSYSYEAHEAMTRARADKPVQQVFKQTQCHPLMDPHGVKAPGVSRQRHAPQLAGHRVCARCHRVDGQDPRPPRPRAAAVSS
jgi:hypothetical protein